MDSHHVSRSGLSARIGSSSNVTSGQLVEELEKLGLIKFPSKIGSEVFHTVNLTLDGWEQYEAEKRGGF